MLNDSRIRILVVDDEPSICESLQDYLEDFGFNVLTANDADKALEILARESWDAAIIDMRLPGMNGDLLVQKARQLQPDLRFLIHTGSSNYHPSKELSDAGVGPEHIFIKPIPNLNLLKEAIEKIVQEKRQHNA
jgi:CheY-like chemotaxis protein